MVYINLKILFLVLFLIVTSVASSVTFADLDPKCAYLEEGTALYVYLGNDELKYFIASIPITLSNDISKLMVESIDGDCYAITKSMLEVIKAEIISKQEYRDFVKSHPKPIKPNIKFSYYISLPTKFCKDQTNYCFILFDTESNKIDYNTLINCRSNQNQFFPSPIIKYKLSSCKGSM